MTVGAPALPIGTVAAPTSRRSARWRSIATAPPVLALTLAALALGVRAPGLVRSFELWSDEMLYADLGSSISRGHMPRLADGPFFLHPPGFFLIEAGFIKLFSLRTGDSMLLVYDLRWLTAALGAVTVGLTFLLVRRLAGTTTAGWAALLLTFEPFVLRNNSRVFLETAGGAAVLGGLLLLVHQMHRLDGPGRRLPLLLAGLLLGYGILVKDVFAFYGLVPVMLATVWRRTVSRRDATAVIVGALTPYATYVVVLWVTGHLGGWAEAKRTGLLRLVGAEQSTGFNAPDAPSFVSRLIEHVAQFGTSYLMLALCPLAGTVAAFSSRPDRRLIGLTAVVMGGLGGYLAVFGTFEEHFGYAVMLAGVVALASAGSELLECGRVPRRPVVIVTTAVLAVTVVLGVRLERTTDDAFLEFREWAAVDLPAHARVAVTSGTAEWAFENYQQFGTWPTPRLMAANGAHYILTESAPTTAGYTEARPALLRWLTLNAVPLFRSDDPTNGVTILWWIGPEALDRAAALDIGGPSPASAPNIVPNQPFGGE